MSELYQHFKGGVYSKLGEATHTETGETLAIYTDRDCKLWVRPLVMFEEVVTWPNGERLPRFFRVPTINHEDDTWEMTEEEAHHALTGE